MNAGSVIISLDTKMRGDHEIPGAARPHPKTSCFTLPPGFAGGGLSLPSPRLCGGRAGWGVFVRAGIVKDEINYATSIPRSRT
jgi:hypothetical protein